MPKYKPYVGPDDKYDLIASMQFNLLTFMGLRDYHKLLDIGCGSLRVGRLLIPYLLKGNYFGLEPEKWLVNEALANELGRDILGTKNRLSCIIATLILKNSTKYLTLSLLNLFFLILA